MNKNKKPKESFSCFIPVYGLDIGNNFNGELTIERVTFIRADKIPRIRKKLGLPKPISHYQKRQRPFGGRKILSEAKTYAYLKSRRNPDSQSFETEMRCVLEALWILGSTMLGHIDRGRCDISLRPYPEAKFFEEFYNFKNNSDDFTVHHTVFTAVEDFSFHTFWKRSLKRNNYIKLLRIIHGDIPVNTKWRTNLRTAAIIAGQSQFARYLHEAFFLDMVGIETLLAYPGDKFPDALINRLFALFGWLTDEKSEMWKSIVKRLYEQRCSFVHSGEQKEITWTDLHNADTILANLLMNLSGLTKTIKSKQDIIAYANEIEARKILGKKPRVGKLPLFFKRRALTKQEVNRLSKSSIWSW